MSSDISAILRDWDFDPEDVHVRIVPGDDGQEKIQMRVELGLLQMELHGRPDGTRPENYESWLEYYEEMRRIHESTHPDTEPYQLQDHDCNRLWREGVQYYHRYLSFWYLEKFELCARDASRNLRLFSFVRAHVNQDRQKLQFDQWRPYVLMIHTRAVATPMVRQGKYTEALEQIDQGIDGIREFLEEYGQAHKAEQCNETLDLEHWREAVQLEQAKTAEAGEETAVEMLRRKLKEAIAAERFEEAARLRDEIRRQGEEAGKP